MALDFRTAVARALGEREGDLRALAAGVVDQELARMVGEMIAAELEQRQNGDDRPAEAEPTPPATRRCKLCGQSKPVSEYQPAELRKRRAACRSCRSAEYADYKRRKRERERAAAADDEEPHPVVSTGSRSGARQIRRGGHLLGPMELAAAEQPREAIEAARMNGVEYVERGGRTFTLLHLPAELDPSRRGDASPPIRSHAPLVMVDVFN